MSDTDTEGLRERLRVRLGVVRLRLRELELDATLVRGRIEEAREEEMALIELLDETPRRRPGRPREADIVEMPDRVAGGMQETPVEETAV